MPKCAGFAETMFFAGKSQLYLLPISYTPYTLSILRIGMGVGWGWEEGSCKLEVRSWMLEEFMFFASQSSVVARSAFL